MIKMDFHNIFVRKKSGNTEPWNDEKILIAIKKSADRISRTMTEKEKQDLLTQVKEILSSHKEDYIHDDTFIIPIISVHSAVEMGLDKVMPDVGHSYRDYRNWVKTNAEQMQRIYERGQSILNRGDSSNADAVDNGNADASLCSTQGAKIRDFLLTSQYETYFLTKEERIAAEIGYIYVHDKNLRQLTYNCDLFDASSVLSGGFEMGNMWYNEPTHLSSAMDVLGDIILSKASQQYGGLTLPRVDAILDKYAQMSYERYLKVYKNNKYPDQDAQEAVIKDFLQGCQAWEYKFNTVASSRGDYPFISISFGLQNTRWGCQCCFAILKTRMEGQGKKGFKKPVLFPKLIFLYDENLHAEDRPMADVFDMALECSCKTMYPDYLSLTGEGYVAGMYKKYGKAISPMGCRAFLSPWFERGGMHPADDEDMPVFEGRFNIGVVSLNLPMILAKARQENTSFYEELDYYLNMIRNIHKRTYDYLGSKNASIDPLGFCEGGFYGGHLKLNDKIKPLLKSATASFGITALNELQYLYNKKTIRQDGQFALDVMKYINDQIDRFKEEDGHLYAIYGTPAEKLCETQVMQFRKQYGIVEGVSDRLYVSNSFHCHVTEDITPIEKQDLEHRFWDYFNGGKIQYCRYSISYNKQAVRTLVERAMKMGFYEGVNLSLAYCDDCGFEGLEMDVCPECGSRNLTKIDRMNGYLAYSRVHGDTRLNKGKMAEIAERKSM